MTLLDVRAGIAPLSRPVKSNRTIPAVDAEVIPAMLAPDGGLSRGLLFGALRPRRWQQQPGVEQLHGRIDVPEPRAPNTPRCLPRAGLFQAAPAHFLFLGSEA